MEINDPDLEKRRKVWQSYVPEKVKVLLIGEAPPAEERYFYYPESPKHDTLFTETMRAVLPGLENADIDYIRKNKPELLKRFKDYGYLLIDAIEYRIPSTTPEKDRLRLIRENEKDLLERVSRLNGNFYAYGVKKSIFVGLSEEAKKAVGFWNAMIPFPSNGHQIEYRRKLRETLSARRFILDLDECEITHISEE